MSKFSSSVVTEIFQWSYDGASLSTGFIIKSEMKNPTCTQESKSKIKNLLWSSHQCYWGNESLLVRSHFVMTHIWLENLLKSWLATTYNVHSSSSTPSTLPSLELSDQLLFLCVNMSSISNATSFAPNLVKVGSTMLFSRSSTILATSLITSESSFCGMLSSWLEFTISLHH